MPEEQKPTAREERKKRREARRKRIEAIFNSPRQNAETKIVSVRLSKAALADVAAIMAARQPWLSRNHFYWVSAYTRTHAIHEALAAYAIQLEQEAKGGAS